MMVALKVSRVSCLEKTIGFELWKNYLKIAQSEIWREDVTAGERHHVIWICFTCGI